MIILLKETKNALISDYTGQHWSWNVCGEEDATIKVLHILNTFRKGTLRCPCPVADSCDSFCLLTKAGFMLACSSVDPKARI